MPALSPTMEEGKLSKWHVKEGDEVHSGDILAEIETDKATMEFEAVDEGTIGKILVPEGTEGVKVNQPIATLIGEDAGSGGGLDIHAAMASIKDAVASETKEVKAAKSSPSHPLTPTPSPSGGEGEDNKKSLAPAERGRGLGEGATPPSHQENRVFASPLARKIAEQAGVDIASLKGSGPRGRIVKADVEAASLGTRRAAAPRDDARHPEAPAQRAPKDVSIPDAKLFYNPEHYEEIPHDSMRKTIARRLTSAKMLIPHFYLTIDCNIDELMDTRGRLNERAPKGEGAYKLSVNDFIVKACALALLRVPEVNASWTDTAILRHKHADVGVAVALDFGLITPIVFRAEEKGLAIISNEVKALAERARNKKLKPQEYEGGGFSVSNLGMFGIRDFTAVINPPQSAILAVGAGEQRAIVRDGILKTATMMTVTMSCDHRVIDGATGARFLQAFKSFIEEPAAMLL
jgi:pyruvate dehydrogenase E2 component (dihydrolipoamide acetyltransferase)